MSNTKVLNASLNPARAIPTTEYRGAPVAAEPLGMLDGLKSHTVGKTSSAKAKQGPGTNGRRTKARDQALQREVGTAPNPDEDQSITTAAFREVTGLLAVAYERYRRIRTVAAERDINVLDCGLAMSTDLSVH